MTERDAGGVSWSPNPGTAAFVLAAGGSSRFGDGHKLTAVVNGRPVIAWSVAAALEADVASVHVVWGAIDLSDLLPSGVMTEHNPDWAAGQATSLACAVRAARRDRRAALVVGLGDQPMVGAEAWRRVAASAAAIAVATYGGRRRNPVRFAAETWDLLPTVGDEGARQVIRRNDSIVEEIPCPGDPTDVDTLEDLARWS